MSQRVTNRLMVYESPHITYVGSCGTGDVDRRACLRLGERPPPRFSVVPHLVVRRASGCLQVMSPRSSCATIIITPVSLPSGPLSALAHAHIVDIDTLQRLRLSLPLLPQPLLPGPSSAVTLRHDLLPSSAARELPLLQPSPPLWPCPHATRPTAPVFSLRLASISDAS